MARHNQLGKIGEAAAARYLEAKGYTLLHIDWRSGHIDLDIVAQKDGVLVFVEVKTRANDYFGEPEMAVDQRKIRRLITAAEHYVRHFGIDAPVRFDVISVVGEEEPFRITHYEDAFVSPLW